MIGTAAPATDMESHAGRLSAASAIVVSCNRPQLLYETVQSLLAGHYAPAEIIVVDQSDERDLRLASLKDEQGCEIRYVWTEVKGAARARNLGIELAHNELLAFADDDLYFAPDWFAVLMHSLLESGDRVVVTGQVRPADSGETSAPSLKVDERPALYEGRVGIDVLYSGNMALYKSAVEAVGGFDERLGPGTRFPSAEDNDLGFRLLEAGYRIRYVPQAVVYHRAWRTSGDWLRLRQSYGIGRGAFYAKHLRRNDWYMVKRMASDITNHLIHSAYRMRRDRRGALGDLVLAFGIAMGAIHWSLQSKRG